MSAKTQLINSINRFHLKIYDCDCVDLGTEWQSNVINPSYSRLYFILGGDGWVGTEEGRFTLRPGYCYLLPSLFSFQCGCRTQMRQIFFHMALLDENDQDVFPYINSPLSCPFHPSKKEELIRIIDAGEHTASDALQIHSMLLEAVSQLLETRQINLPEKNYSPCASNALQYIHRHASARLTLEEVTRYSFTSQTTLSKRFRQELGVTVGRYIENLVFTQAQYMLRDPSLSIAQVSERLGFCDQFYFSSRFKRRFSQSPQSFRKSTVV